MKYLLKVYDQEEREIATIKFDTYLELLHHLTDRCDYYLYWPENVEDLDKLLNEHCYEWYQLKVYKIK